MVNLGKQLLAGVLTLALVSGSVPAAALTMPSPLRRPSPSLIQTQAIPAAIVFGTLAPLLSDSISVRQLIHTVLSLAPFAIAGMAFTMHHHPEKAFPYPWLIQLDLTNDKNLKENNIIRLTANPHERVEQKEMKAVHQLIRYIGMLRPVLPRGLDGIVILAPQKASYATTDEVVAVNVLKLGLRLAFPTMDGVLFSDFEGRKLISIPFNRIPRKDLLEPEVFSHQMHALMRQIKSQAEVHLYRQVKPPSDLAAWGLLGPVYRFASRQNPLLGWIFLPALLETLAILAMNAAMGSMAAALLSWHVIHALDWQSPRLRGWMLLNPILAFTGIVSWSMAFLFNLDVLSAGVVFFGIHFLINFTAYSMARQTAALNRNYYWERVRRYMRGNENALIVEDELIVLANQLKKLDESVLGILKNPEQYPDRKGDLTQALGWINHWSAPVTALMPIPIWVFHKQVRRYIRDIFEGKRVTLESSLTDLINLFAGIPEKWVRFWGWRQVQLRLELDLGNHPDVPEPHIPRQLEPLAAALENLMAALVIPELEPNKELIIDESAVRIQAWIRHYSSRWGAPPWYILPQRMKNAIQRLRDSPLAGDQIRGAGLMAIFKDVKETNPSERNGPRGGGRFIPRLDTAPNPPESARPQRLFRTAA